MLKKIKSEIFIVLILYILITLAMTFPLVTKMHNHLFKGFFPTSYDAKKFEWEPVWDNVHPDALGWVYVFAWNSHILTTNPKNYFNANMYYPNKNTLAYNSFSLTDSLIAMPFNLIFKNPILAYNFLIIFSYVSAAFTMYLLTNYFLRNRLISFLSGLMFVFTWFNYLRIQDVVIISVEWIPLSLLFLFKFFKEKKFKYILTAGIFYLFQALTEWYSAVFLAYTLCLCALINTFYKGKEALSIKNLLSIIIVIALVAAVLYPFAIPYLENRSQFTDFKRTKDDALWKAFYLDDYLFPKDKIRYIQYIFLFIVFFFPLKFKNSEIDKEQIKIAKSFFIILALFSFIISLGPKLKAFSRVWNISLPYSFLFDYLPGFEVTRDARRFEILFILSLSFLTSLTLYHFLERIRNIKFRNGIIIASMAIPLLSYTSITNFSSMLYYIPSYNGEKIHNIYKWLSSLKEDVSIYQTLYEQGSFRKPGNSFMESILTYYSIFHWKKTVNGITWWIPPNYKKLIEMKEQFPSERFLDELKKLKTDYIIVIDCKWDVLDVKDGPLDKLIRNGDIKLIKKFTGKKRLFFSYAYKILYKEMKKT